jgi:hypothetical protein
MIHRIGYLMYRKLWLRERDRSPTVADPSWLQERAQHSTADLQWGCHDQARHCTSPHARSFQPVRARAAAAALHA